MAHSESLDTRILHVLYEYHQQHPGDSELNVNDLYAQLADVRREDVHTELKRLQGKGWIDCDLTTDGQSGLVRIEPKGIRVVTPTSDVGRFKRSGTDISETDAEQPAALLPDYAHDIVVCYAAEDDQDTWVSTTIKHLDAFLNMRITGLRWHACEACTPETVAAVRQGAICVIVLSRQYVNSAWCQDPDLAFLQKVQTKMQQGEKLLLLELDKTERPPAFGSSVGYPFWVMEKQTQALRTIPLPESRTPYAQHYWNQLFQLCNDLDNEIQRLRKRASIQQQLEQAGVVIDNDTVDKPLAAGIVKKLQAHGVGYIFPLSQVFQGQLQTDMREVVEQTVLGSDGLVLVYGEASGSWLVKEVNHMRRIFAKHRQTHPPAYAIYDGPPATNPLPEAFGFPGLILNCRNCQQVNGDCRDCPNQQRFVEFIERLKRTTGIT